jgi:hypothetical protein
LPAFAALLRFDIRGYRPPWGTVIPATRDVKAPPVEWSSVDFMRLAFRILLAATLIVLLLGRVSGGKLLPTALFPPFIVWFSVSVFVFGVFGLRAAYLAWRDPANRRAYMFDVILALAWVPYWFLMRK